MKHIALALTCTLALSGAALAQQLTPKQLPGAGEFPGPEKTRADYRLERLIGSGDALPDGNGVYSISLFPPVIDAAGRVAVSAFTSGSSTGALDDEVLLVLDGETVGLRLREGQPVPNGNGVYGTPFNGQQPVFSWPSFTGDGAVATHASILSPQPLDSGVMLTRPGSVSRLLRIAQELPGGRRISEILAGSVAMDANGSVAILIDSVPIGGGAARMGVWRFGGRQATPVLEVGDPSPDGVGVVSNFHWGWVAHGSGGEAAFVATLLDGTGTEGALLLDGAGGLEVVAREGAPVLPNLVYASIDDFAGGVVPVIDGSGKLAARAQLKSSPPGAAQNSSAIFHGATAPLSITAQETEVPPSGGGEIIGLMSPQISPGGNEAFVGLYAGQGGWISDAGALRVLDGGQLDHVVRTGDPLPGGGRVGHALHVPQINDAGRVAITVSLAGTGFPYPSDTVLVWRDAGGDLVELLRTGDLLDGRTVLYINLPVVSDPGGHRALNEAGELTFEVTFEDWTTAIYVARPR